MTTHDHHRAATTAAAEPVPAPRHSAQRAVQAGALAALGSAVGVVILAQVAKAGGVAHEHQLAASSLIVTTIVGVLAGTVGWLLVSRRARRPHAVLRTLVPAVLVLSFVPDLLIAIGGTTWGAALTLAVAHVVVFAVTLPILQRFLPLPATAS